MSKSCDLGTCCEPSPCSLGGNGRPGPQGAPAFLRGDNGQEFSAKEGAALAGPTLGQDTISIDPGSP